MTADDQQRLVALYGQEWANRFLEGTRQRPDEFTLALARILEAARAKRASA
jgi:hypothetical protein